MAQMANALVNAFGAYTHKQAVRKEASEKSAEEKNSDVRSQSSEVRIQNSDTLTTNDQRQPLHGLLYAIQICASKTPLKPNDPQLKGQVCECMKVGEWYKYYTAADPDRAKVMEARKKLLSLFPDCWIIKVER
jgi:hypothetical protein